MRAPLLLPIFLAAAGVSLALPARAEGPGPTPSDVEQARGLDREGARAFREGRYNDAVRFFEDAFKLGAPDVELWNVARCYLKLDEPEEASRALQRYLDRPDLSPSDRAEAKNQLTQLERRHSTLTVTSSPAGAYAIVDGRPAGRTPATVDLAPGDHVVLVRRDAVTLHEERVTARFGRAVIVEASPDREADRVGPRGRRFTMDGELGFFWSTLGKIGGTVHPAGMLGAGYALHDGERLVVALGLSSSLTYDTWGALNEPGPRGTPESPPGCTLPENFSGTALSAFVDATLGVRATRRLRFEGGFGLGMAGDFVPRGGGTVFEPACSPHPGIQPALHVRGAFTVAVSPAVRLVGAPLWLEVQHGFAGTRTSPVDASAPWARVGSGLGVAIDL